MGWGIYQSSGKILLRTTSDLFDRSDIFGTVSSQQCNNDLDRAVYTCQPFILVCTFLCVSLVKTSTQIHTCPPHMCVHCSLCSLLFTVLTCSLCVHCVSNCPPVSTLTREEWACHSKTQPLYCILLVDRLTQLICVSDICYSSTDKYKSHCKDLSVYHILPSAQNNAFSKYWMYAPLSPKHHTHTLESVKEVSKKCGIVINLAKVLAPKFHINTKIAIFNIDLISDSTLLIQSRFHS